ncbi:MAG: sugar transferase, partial [Candidatus Aminicenantales bacterium]
RCKKFGVPVYVTSELFNVVVDKVNVEEFEDSSAPSIRSTNRVYRELVKPFVDFMLSFTALLFLLPFLPPVALALKLSSKGPVFYRRKAYGKDGRPFIQYKLRTMRMNSDEQIHRRFMEDMILNQKRKGDFKIKNDPRVTKVGKILRKFSLDELPQLYNVLKGDMSLIGPRPSLEYEYRIQRKWHKKRYSVLPGLSGLWQAFGRSSVSYDDMVIMDIYYEENLSLWLDLKIFFQTIPNLVLGKGAY